MSSSRLLAIFFGLCVIVLGVGIVFASLEESLAAGLAKVVDGRWGVVTLVDLYVGLIFIALWIAWIERSWWRALLWTLGLFALGNLTTAIYVAVRAWRAPSVTAFFTARRPISPAPPTPPR